MAEQSGRIVRIGGLALGGGMPKICIPVMGADIGQIAQAAERAQRARADLIELRIDSLAPSPSAQEAIDACGCVRQHAPGTPLLFTQRTVRDGGRGSADAAAYEALLTEICAQRAADAVDCELSVGEEAFVRIVRAAHEAGMAVVGSSHEFGHIGDMERAGQWLLAQKRLGADVLKAAVMTHTKAEAMQAAWVMTRTAEKLDAPVIAIAMGAAGVITRIGAQCMGSCLTFGTAGDASAPGQMDALELRRVLETVHAAMA
ncbi:MAG: type I 3-dehydroquinate dehydratase [Clostridia bacterium]|nr:type I 3-dehydroquinate dehydratase [Clostridia bacterium]